MWNRSTSICSNLASVITVRSEYIWSAFKCVFQCRQSAIQSLKLHVNARCKVGLSVRFKGKTDHLTILTLSCRILCKSNQGLQVRYTRLQSLNSSQIEIFDRSLTDINFRFFITVHKCNHAKTSNSSALNGLIDLEIIRSISQILVSNYWCVIWIFETLKQSR